MPGGHPDEEGIFESARQIEDAKERSIYLSEACGADESLRARIEALLQADEVEDGFLQTGDIATEQTLPPVEEAEVRNLWGESLSPDVTPGMTIKRVSGTGSAPTRYVVKRHVVSEPSDSGPELPDYELLGRIGEGGMGVVYAARQTAVARTR